MIFFAIAFLCFFALFVIVWMTKCYCSHDWLKLQTDTDRWISAQKKPYYTMRRCKNCDKKEYYFSKQRGWVEVAWLPERGTELENVKNEE